MRLVIEDDAGARSIVPFASDEITVGRAGEGVTFRLADRNVSRRHARFVRQKSDVWVEDLGSLVGTLVNGEKISSRRKLRAGDIVQIGDYDLAVLTDDAALPEAAPSPKAGAAAPDGKPAPAEPTVLLATAEIRAIAAGVMTPPASPAPPPERPAVTAPVPAPAAAHGPRRPVLAVLVAGGIALAIGAAAGFAVGRYVVPPAGATGSR